MTLKVTSRVVFDLFLVLAVFSTAYYVYSTEKKVEALQYETRYKQGETEASMWAISELMKLETSRVNKVLAATDAKTLEEMRKIASTVVATYEDFDKKSKALASWAIETEANFKRVVGIYDKNVEAYNKQFVAIAGQISYLDAEVKRHREAIILMARAK